MFVVHRLRGRLGWLHCIRRYGEPHGGIFGFWRRGGPCGLFSVRRSLSSVVPGPRGRPLGSCCVGCLGQFLVSGGAAAFAGRSCPPVFPFVVPGPRGRPLGSCRVGCLGQFLVSGGAAALAGRSCPPVVFSQSF